MKYFLFFSALFFFGCSANKKEDSANLAFAGKEMESPTQEAKQHSPRKNQKQETQMEALFRVAGFPKYGPNVSCKDVLSDLQTKGLKIVSLQDDTIIAQSAKLNITANYSFDDQSCTQL